MLKLRLAADQTVSVSMCCYICCASVTSWHGGLYNRNVWQIVCDLLVSMQCSMVGNK